MTGYYSRLPLATLRLVLFGWLFLPMATGAEPVVQAPIASPPQVSGNPLRNPVPPAAPEVSAAAKPIPEQKHPLNVEETTKLAQDRLAAVQQSTDVAEDEKTKTITILKEALDWTRMANEAAEKTAALKAETAGAPKAIEQAQLQLTQPTGEPTLDVPWNATVTQLEQRLAEAEQAQAATQQLLDRLHTDLTKRTERQAQLAKWLAEATSRLNEMPDTQPRKTTAENARPSDDAMRLAAHARRLAAQQQVWMYQAEAIRHKAVAAWLPLKRDLIKRTLSHEEQTVAAWKKRIRNYRAFQAESQSRRAKELAAQMPDALQPLVAQTADYAEQRMTLVAKLDQIAADAQVAQSSWDTVQKTHTTIREKVDGAGLSLAIGLLLRKHRQELPSLTPFRQQLDQIDQEIPPIQLTLLELQAVREEMADLDAMTERAVQRVPTSEVSEETRPEAIRTLLAEQRDCLDDLIHDTSVYQEQLTDADIAARGLIDATTAFRAYIDERILWVRSTDPLQTDDVRSSLDALIAMTSPKEWQGVARAVWNRLRRHWISTLIMMACVAGIFLAGGRLDRRLRRASDREDDRIELSLRPVLEAAGLTLVTAAIWPSMFLLVSWLLAESGQTHEMARALAEVFALTGVLFFAVEVVRKTCRRGGLAERIFGWPTEMLCNIRGNLRWLIVGGLPVLFIVVLSRTYQEGVWADSLGRLAFIVGMLLVACLLARMARTSDGVLGQLETHEALRSMRRFRWLWVPAMVGTPLALALLAGMGYYYSANELAVRAKITSWCFIAIVFGCAFLTHLVSVVAHRMALRRRVELDRAARDRMATATDPEAHAPEQDDEAELEQITAQAIRLLRGAAIATFLISAWITWAEVLPAFQLLDKVELWTAMRTVSEEVTDPEGNVTTQVNTARVPVTLKALLFSLAIFYGTIVLAKNLPSLLRIVVLDRLRIDHGGCHAIALLCRYALFAAGAIVGFQVLGVSWSSLQWMVAAMTVGLGFGLQEIFANFVSGLIILFERPVRIGDLVTVGTTTGHIARIQIRATTIRDFDRRETIVPNKTFITGEVMNWTLSDPVTRVVIPVGVAYGSDTARAQEELLSVARRHPFILSDPEPSAIFLGFGASTLDFELRFFIGSRDVYGTVLHETNTAIDKAFREAGLEIAFPQQDLHIRSIDTILPGLAAAPSEDTQRRAA